MNQHVGHWVRKQIGIGDKPMKIPLRLVDGIKALLPQHGALLAGHHDAGADHVCIQPFRPDGQPGPDLTILEALAPS